MFKNYTILLVEDDINLQKYMTQILEDACSKLFVASDGKEGLAMYKLYTPDIIISDLNMPKMDGLSMCRDIKVDNFKQPIILFTGHGDVAKLEKAINIGINAFISKPILDIDILFKTIKKIIKQIDYNIDVNSNQKKAILEKKKVKNLMDQILYDDHDYITYDALK